MTDPVPTGPTSPEAVASSRRRIAGPFAAAAVTLGLVTWPIAFNYGAFGVFFYRDVFRVVVASSILFLVTFTERVYPQPRIWLVRLALAAPLLWLLAAAYLVGSTTEALGRIGFEIWLVGIFCASVPITLRLLVDLFVPQFTRAGSRRLTVTIVAVVAAVSVFGFVAGRQNPRFLVCTDFSTAGDAEPDNCRSSTDEEAEVTDDS